MMDCSPDRGTGWIVRPFITTIAGSLLAFGGCSKHEAIHTSPPAPPKRPELLIEVRPPAVRDDLKPGSSFEIACSVNVQSGGYEPMTAVFQLSDPKTRGKSRLSTESQATNEKTHEGGVYTFASKLNAPIKPGRYVIDVKVIGLDPSLPSSEPPQAPAADGAPAKSGAHAEFDAPTLEVEVKK